MDKIRYSELHEMVEDLAKKILDLFDPDDLKNWLDPHVICEVNDKYPFSEFASLFTAYFIEAMPYIRAHPERIFPTAVVRHMNKKGLPKDPLLSRDQKRKKKKEWTRDYVLNQQKEFVCPLSKKELPPSFDEMDAVYNAIYYAEKNKLFRVF